MDLTFQNIVRVDVKKNQTTFAIYFRWLSGQLVF